MRRTPLKRQRDKPRRKGKPVKSGILRTHQKRYRRHLDWLATLPCGVCGSRYGVVGAHLRLHTDGCMGDKPSDFWAWPSCFECHSVTQHQKGEPYYFRLWSVDPWRLCYAYALASPFEAVRLAAEQVMLPHIEQLEAA